MGTAPSHQADSSLLLGLACQGLLTHPHKPDPTVGGRGSSQGPPGPGPRSPPACRWEAWGGDSCRHWPSVALGLASPCGNVSFLLGSESPERSRSPRSVESVLGGGCSRRAAPCPLPAHTESHSSCAPAPGGPSDHTSQPRSRGQRPQGPFKQTRLGRCCRGPACDPIRHPQRPCLWTLQLRGPQGRSLWGWPAPSPSPCLTALPGSSTDHPWEGRVSEPCSGPWQGLALGSREVAPEQHPPSKIGGPRPRAGGVEARHCLARLSVRDHGQD